MKILPIFLAGAVSLMAVSVGVAQGASPLPPPEAQYAPGSPAPPNFQQAPPYFALEHRNSAHMDPADTAIVEAKHGELVREAEFYGYQIGVGSWVFEQVVCPAMPDSIMLHFSSTEPDGRESLFTALVPRNASRIRIVPVYYRSGTPYHPAVKNDRNFVLFNELVPSDIAKKSADPDGQWLSLAVSYVEMVGGSPRVPRLPEIEPETVLATQPTLFVASVSRERKITFTDRDAEKSYTTWSVSLNADGRVFRADSEEHALHVTLVSNPSVPEAKLTHPAPPPAASVTHPAVVPVGKITLKAPPPEGKIVQPADAPH
jgi:hypothetical protein